MGSSVKVCARFLRTHQSLSSCYSLVSSLLRLHPPTKCEEEEEELSWQSCNLCSRNLIALSPFPCVIASFRELYSFISLFSGQVKKLRKCSRKNPCCSEMMSCSKWIAEEIEKPGVETLLAENHILFNGYLKNHMSCSNR
jgi:hypothetical protein